MAKLQAAEEAKIFPLLKKGKGKKGSGQEKGASAAPSTAVPEKVRVGPVWQLQ